jgi:hypothetical protein
MPCTPSACSTAPRWTGCRYPRVCAAAVPPSPATTMPAVVLVPPGHRLAGLDAIPVAVLAEEPLLLAEEARAPEFNRHTGFTPA